MSDKTENISRWRRKSAIGKGKRAAAEVVRKRFKDSRLLSAIYLVAYVLLATLALFICNREGDGYVASRWGLAAVDVVFVLFSALGMYIMLTLLAPETLARNSRVCLLLVVGLIAIYITGLEKIFIFDGGISLFGYDIDSRVEPFLYPYVLAPVMGTLLLGPGAGVAVAASTSIIIMRFAATDGALIVTVMGLLAAIMAPQLVVHRIRRRLQLLRASLIAGVVLTVCAYLSWVVKSGVESASDIDMDVFLSQAGACLLSAFVCAFLVMLLILPLQRFFAVSSDMKLNDYADLSSKLMERFSTEAPGTFNHCLMVAQLAVHAAERIGANPLLARVASYHHDIGKLTNPRLFAENYPHDPGYVDPHSKLSPSTSAAWIRAHVKDGVVLAEQYSLPPPVKDVIWEHHGTTIIEYFYNKALKQAEEKEKQCILTSPNPASCRREVVDEGLYRYPGPKPTTKESAIIMLADSVEAATRSMFKPTISSLEKKVSDIFTKKSLDGQFDSCPLTMKDLAIVKRSFLESLSNILHSRIAYPEAEKPKDKDRPKEKEHDAPSVHSEPPAQASDK